MPSSTTLRYGVTKVAPNSHIIGVPSNLKSQGFSAESFMISLSRATNKHSLKDLEFKVRQVFGKLRVLMNSFQKSEVPAGRNALVMSWASILSQTTTPQELDEVDPALQRLDLAGASTVLQKLCSMPTMPTVLAASLQRLLMELREEAKNFTEPEEIIVFLVLIQVPLLQKLKVSNHAYLLELLVDSYLMMSEKARRKLMLMLYKCGREQWLLLLRMLRKAVRLQTTGYKLDPFLLNCLLLLKDIYEFACIQRKVLDYTEFYDRKFVSRLDLRFEWRAWRLTKNDDRQIIPLLRSGTPPRCTFTTKSGETFTGIFDFPFMFDAVTKAKLVRIESFWSMCTGLVDKLCLLVLMDITQTIDPPPHVVVPTHLILEIRRDHIVEDTISQLSAKMQDIFLPLQVKFADEMGVDQGGLQKELFQLFVHQLFEEKKLWRYDDEHRQVWFDIDATDEESLTKYRFLGLIMGLAMYNGLILDLHFPSVLYKKLLGQPVTFDDLNTFNPDLAKGLGQLISFEGNVADTFCQDFQITYETANGMKTVELVEGGANIPVTNENRNEYVKLYVNWILEKSVEKQFNAMMSGFQIVNGYYNLALKMLRAEELEELVCGITDLDFTELKRAATLEGYLPTDEVIIWFWDVVMDMSNEDKKKFLQFVTGSDRVPVGGLQTLGIKIQKDGECDRLPTTHTCFAILLLPPYKSKDMLESRLLTAIQNCTGFGLI